MLKVETFPVFLSLIAFCGVVYWVEKQRSFFCEVDMGLDPTVDDLAGLLVKAASKLTEMQKREVRHLAEIDKRDEIIDELRDEVDMLKANIKRMEAGECSVEFKNNDR